ncbi:MAG: glycosyltransferase family 4 protein, partial [Chloroflexi bacterium]|nr:glycosyltransferase family 4 protein [Chloroflexota bacterium]
DSEPASENLAAMAPYCRHMQAFVRSPRPRLFPPRLAPPAVYLDDRPEMRAAIQSLESTTRFQVLQIDFPSLAQYLDYRKDSVTVMTELDVTFLTLWRHFQVERSMRLKPRRLVAALLFFYYELSHLPRFDRVVAMSDFDRDVFRRWMPTLSVQVIPNGVDCAHFDSIQRRGEPPALLFVGNFAHPPNVDAVTFFVRAIWPELSQRFPDLKFIVVGDPTPAVRALASDRIILAGRARNYSSPGSPVPDIRDFYAQASVVVVPVRYGSGTRLKLLEAFAAGVPVVSTRMGAEGLQIEPEEHFLSAESPADFVAQTSRLLSDRQLADRLAAQARLVVENRYDWKILARMQVDMYRQTFESRIRLASDGKNVTPSRIT